jgi:hypothetical protein
MTKTKLTECTTCLGIGEIVRHESGTKPESMFRTCTTCNGSGTIETEIDPPVVKSPSGDLGVNQFDNILHTHGARTIPPDPHSYYRADRHQKDFDEDI